MKALALLAVLAFIVYLPTLNLPFLEDDYPNITMGMRLASPAGWPELAEHPIYRVRAMTHFAAAWLAAGFRDNVVPYRLTSLAVHIVNCWLLYALFRSFRAGFVAALCGAAFFAVREGHNEALMWFSALAEPLQFLFGGTALLFWLRYLRERKIGYYLLSVLSFLLALHSKESAVIFAGFLAAAWWLEGRRPGDLPALGGFLLAAGLSASAILFDQSRFFRFRDGSFSLEAPFWITLPYSLLRLFWVGGALALLLAWRFRMWKALGWSIAACVAGLLPYVFLTYSTRVPSRQTYVAGAGMAWLVGLTAAELWRRYNQSHRQYLMAAAAAVFVLNTYYIWIPKREQFLQRAEPTDRLIALARRERRPIYIQCFPRQRLIAEEAVHWITGRPVADLIWDSSTAKLRNAVSFCAIE